jgi:hypothetical protein
MDAITFAMGDYSIELRDGQAFIWKAATEGAMTLQAVLPLARLMDALSAARMLKS